MRLRSLATVTTAIGVTCAIGVYAQTPPSKPLKPRNVSVTLPADSVPAGERLTLTAVYEGATAAEEVTHAMVKLDEHDDDALYVQYSRPRHGRLLLRDDAGDYGDGCVPGTSVVLKQSRGELLCENSYVTQDGKQLRLVLTFRPSTKYVGTHEVHIMSSSRGGDTDFEYKGRLEVKAGKADSKTRGPSGTK